MDCQQGDRRAALRQRRHGQGPSPEPPLQAGRQGPNPRRDDRVEAGNHRILIARKGHSDHPFEGFLAQRGARNLQTLCARYPQTLPMLPPGAGLRLMRLVAGVSLVVQMIGTLWKSFLHVHLWRSGILGQSAKIQQSRGQGDETTASPRLRSCNSVAIGGKLSVWSAVDAGTEVELIIAASRAYAKARVPERPVG